MTSKEIQLAGHETRNSELLKNLVSKGTNLDEVRDIDFFFIFEDREDVNGLEKLGATQISIQSVNKTVTPPPRWYVHTVARMSLSDALSTEISRRFVEIAVQNNGIYDGWGASI